MNLLIRTDSSMGQGHVKRCAALAEAWEDAGGTVAWHDSIILPDRFNGDWLVLDGYDFTEKDQQAAMEQGCRLLVIDDNALLPHYYADIILNQNAHAKSLKYKTGDDCKLLLGPDYVLIRREFRDWRDRREIHESKRVLVALGSAATDEIKATIKSALNSIECESRWADGDAHMPSLMTWADVGIIAAGVSSLEACYMGLPTILLTTAANQDGNAHGLDGEGCGYYLGGADYADKNEITSALGWLLSDDVARQEMRERQMALVDGFGSERVVEVMLGR